MLDTQGISVSAGWVYVCISFTFRIYCSTNWQEILQSIYMQTLSPAMAT